MNTNTDPIAHASAAPQVAQLISEYKRCSPAAGSGWDRQALSDQVRYCRWPGQSPDGKKHGTKDNAAFPFEGASDAQVYLADDLINSLVADDVESFWRAWLMPKFTESEESGYALKLADHFINRALYHEIYVAVELSAQYRHHYGWMAAQPKWTQSIALENKTITLALVEQELVALGMPEAMELFLDPTQEPAAMEVLGLLYAGYTQRLMARLKSFTPKPLKESTRRRAVRELRTKSETTLPIPYIAKDGPEVFIRCPWREVFMTGDTADLNQRRVFLVLWEDGVSLRAKAAEGWDPAWIEEALKHKGKHSAWVDGNGGSTPGAPPVNLNEALGYSEHLTWTQRDYKDGLVETVYCLYRAVDDEDVPGTYMTVLNPHIGHDQQDDEGAKKGLYGWHGLVSGARGQIPLRIGTRERIAANFCSSRGVPEVVNSWQRQLKVQHDGVTDWTSIGVFPPINEYTSQVGGKFRYGPGVRNRYTSPGKEARFMDIPTKGVPVSFEVMQGLKSTARGYFGFPTELEPQGNLSKRQTRVGTFLLFWSSVIQDMLNLAQQNMRDEEFSHITGAPEGWLDAHRDIELGVQLQFDVRELDPEYVLKQMDVMNKTVIPGDVTGALDRNKWTRRQLRMVSPILARDLASDEGEASQRLYEGVKNDLAQMFLGNEAQYTENDPAAQAKLQYASQIVGANPNYQQALQNPESRFSQLVMKYVKNLQFSLTEEANKKVGAIGVKPEQMPG